MAGAVAALSQVRRRQVARSQRDRGLHHPRVTAALRSNAGCVEQLGPATPKPAHPPARGRLGRSERGQDRKATYSSQWVGIEGFNNSSLIQTGTEADYDNGSAHYGAWWEILPAAETVIPSITVHPGDHMSASITKGCGNTWTISITDTTTGASFSTQKTYTGPERLPSGSRKRRPGGRVATLAAYRPGYLRPGHGKRWQPTPGSGCGGVMVQRNQQVSTPSAPDGDTDGFNTASGRTAPAPPSSRRLVQAWGVERGPRAASQHRCGRYVGAPRPCPGGWARAFIGWCDWAERLPRGARSLIR